MIIAHGIQKDYTREPMKNGTQAVEIDYGTSGWRLLYFSMLCVDSL